MITPDFSGERVRNLPSVGRESFEVGGRSNVDRRLPPSPGHRRAKTRQPGHLLIEKHGQERLSHGESSPHTRRREVRANLQEQILSSPSGEKQRHFALAGELHSVGEKLGLCYEELKSGYVREIVRDIELKNTANTDHLLALKDLLQQLLKEMGHVQRLLSRHNVVNASHDDSCKIPRNSEAPHIPGPNDLVHLKGPLTESTIIATLQARFSANCYHTKCGPVHLLLNPFDSCGAIRNDRSHPNENSNISSFLKSLVAKSVERLLQTQMPQLLILSGECASGKSHTAKMIIQELMQHLCGAAQTDMYKQLDASITVLDSLAKARTRNNAESSRMAVLYEFHFNNEVIQKTTVRCIPLNMSRVVHAKKDESNFRIFYQLFAGLNPKDRASLQLQTHSGQELRYLYNYPLHNESEIELLRKEFQSWKSALQFLGIPFSDVTKVLAAILLLGNVQFTEKAPQVLEVQGGDFELKAVALLLGVPYTSLFRGLTKKNKVIQNDQVSQPCTASQANYNRDALAKTLYVRMLSAVVRRCNCARKPQTSSVVLSHSRSPNSSSESLTKSFDRFTMNQSPGNHGESDESVSLNDNEKILGLADLFGFDNSNCNGMEEICANLSSETIQHFYATHVFKSAEGFCREEGIQNEVEVDHVDNSLCIELLTCQQTGILTFLDRETLKNGSVEDFVKAAHEKHASHEKFFTTDCGPREFAIAHHAAKVVYDANELLRNNDDAIADDVIQMFSNEQCSFGFVTHLFALDLKSSEQNHHSEQKGTDHKPRSSVRTVSQEFQGKLDALLKTLIHSDPCFILCLKSNACGSPCQFDTAVVSRQVKSLQIFETVHLLRSGYSRRMRLVPFAQRYFVPDEELSANDALEIAQSYQKVLSEGKRENLGRILYIGRKHVFFSELLWQELERSRPRNYSPEHLGRNSFNASKESSLHLHIPKEDISPISRNESYSRAEYETSTPPAIPRRRGYTVIDNKKVAFPQMRVMTDHYRDTVNGQDVVFSRGENVKVTGASPRAGYLAVETNHKFGWVPYTLTRLLTEDPM